MNLNDIKEKIEKYKQLKMDFVNKQDYEKAARFRNYERNYTEMYDNEELKRKELKEKRIKKIKRLI